VEILFFFCHPELVEGKKRKDCNKLLRQFGFQPRVLEIAPKKNQHNYNRLLRASQ
jgi:hypothetical protein